MEAWYIAEYLETLRIRGLAPGTIELARSALAGFFALTAANGSGSFLATEENDAHQWYRSLIEKGYTPKTAAQNHRTVYRFYRWLQQDRGVLLLNPIPKPSFKFEKSFPRRVPDQKEVQELYSRLRERKRYVEQRDYALVDLGYSCGLRRSELMRLDIDDICIDEQHIRVQGKGKKTRIVPVGARALKDLLYYLYHVRPKLMKDGTTKAVFVSWKEGGRRLYKGSIDKIFYRLRQKYGLTEGFTSHGLRHGFATGLIRNGAPVQDVSKMLGHVCLTTTQIYTRLVPTDLKKHHKKYHPRG